MQYDPTQPQPSDPSQPQQAGGAPSGQPSVPQNGTAPGAQASGQPPQGYGAPGPSQPPQAYGQPGPQGYGPPAAQGYSQPPQAYGAPAAQGYGPPPGYGQPQGYGPPPGYGQPQGYGPGAYGQAAVAKPPTWPLAAAVGAAGAGALAFLYIGMYGGRAVGEAVLALLALTAGAAIAATVGGISAIRAKRTSNGVATLAIAGFGVLAGGGGVLMDHLWRESQKSKYASHDYDDDDKPYKSSSEDRTKTGSKDTKDSKAPAQAPTEAPVANTRQGAFRLGDKLGLAVLGRARGQAAAGERTFASLQPLATELGIVLPPLPKLSGDSTGDTADAMHYLLDTVGKSGVSTLSAKHSQAHAAAFELGLKLNLLNLLYLPNDSLGQGIGGTCASLAKSAGVADSTMAPLMAKIRANDSQDSVGDSVQKVGDAIDRELATATSLPTPTPTPATPAKPKPRRPPPRFDGNMP